MKRTDIPDSYHQGAAARLDGLPNVPPHSTCCADYYWWAAGWGDTDLEIGAE